MRRFSLFAAFLALLPGSLAAQDWATKEVCTVETAEIDPTVFDPQGRDALEAEAAQIENRRGRFWQITGPDGAVSHLWGTLHSSEPLILDLPDIVHQAIEESEVVAVEVDYVAPSREAYRAAQEYEGRFNTASDPFAFSGDDDGTIAGLDLEISDWIRERAIELGWTEDAELILSPAGLAEMLLSDPCEDFASGVLPIQDDYIQLLGRLAGAQILSLETPEEFLDDLNASEATANAIIAVYAAYLKPITSNSERSTSFALYREGRLGLLAALDAAYIEEVLGAAGKDKLRLTDDYLLTYRNQRFLERLADKLADGNAFIAVGAGHLPGNTGLVSLLREAGFDLTRIRLPGEAE